MQDLCARWSTMASSYRRSSHPRWGHTNTLMISYTLHLTFLVVAVSPLTILQFIDFCVYGARCN
jgi:hypothetical protein